MERIIVGQNMLEVEIDGKIELRFVVQNEEERTQQLNALKASFMSATVVDKEDVMVSIAEFEQERDFDWSQSLILLSE